MAVLFPVVIPFNTFNEVLSHRFDMNIFFYWLIDMRCNQYTRLHLKDCFLEYRRSIVYFLFCHIYYT